jgi:hypothetical protein
MHFGALAKTLQAAKNRRAGYLQLPAFVHDGFMQRPALVAIALRAVDAQQFSWLSGRHR